MKSQILLLAPFLALASAASPTLSSSGSVSFTTGTATTRFNPTFPTTTGAAVVSTYAGLYFSWLESPAYTSIQSEVYAAAPTAAQESLAIQGWNWDAIVAADWFKKSVPADAQSVVNGEEKTLQDAVTATAKSGASGMGAKQALAGSLVAGMGAVFVILF